MSTPYNEALGATLIGHQAEQIVLVGVTPPGTSDGDTDASLDELALLIDTAALTSRSLVQRRDHPDHTWFIGKGKVDELETCAWQSTPTPWCSTTSSPRRSSTT
jgi:GTP-binding protein HflX